MKWMKIYVSVGWHTDDREDTIYNMQKGWAMIVTLKMKQDSKIEGKLYREMWYLVFSNKINLAY